MTEKNKDHGVFQMTVHTALRDGKMEVIGLTIREKDHPEGDFVCYGIPKQGYDWADYIDLAGYEMMQMARRFHGIGR